ncbi:chorismate-binding protein [Timonella sp. A28]|uniref:chorismate-binding protein n=1 Tax=Timonella sp. A28 TaxID=3442640 RepID=UPI003EB83A69
MIADAYFAGQRGTTVLDYAHGESLFTALSQGGKWLIVADFDEMIRGWKFDALFKESVPSPHEASSKQFDEIWSGPKSSTWRTSLDENGYKAAVRATREAVAEGTVYQANICRVLSTDLSSPQSPRLLSRRLASGNPAPYQGYAHVESDNPEERLWLASASPELFIRITQSDHGHVIESSPIKGTAKDTSGLTAKDEAENVMITDLVRNDISPLCTPGTVAVRDFLHVESHPGLVHLVSTVEGHIREDILGTNFWKHVFSSTFPPGSVSGAPKSSALSLIKELETHKRGPYCGAFGWVDADDNTATLAVGIRTFWWDEDCEHCLTPSLHFGTGAGITWGSDPDKEWLETELKAERLVSLASRQEES